MALSEDQRALLRLLLEQGQSYEDIGSLLGLSVPEVRDRAASALTEIRGSDPETQVGLTDYLLGQADPIGRADAVRKLSSDPEALVLARKLEAQLTLLAPSANLPELPPSKATKASPKAAESAAPPETTVSEVSSSQKRVIGALLAGAAIVVVIVLVATGAFSSDSPKPSASETATDTPGQSTVASGDAITRATLAPTDGGDASGLAILGKIKKTPAFEVNVTGLTKLPGKRVYLVTLYGSDKAAWPLGLMAVDKDGLGRAQYPFDTSLLTGIANGTFNSIDISIAQLKELNQAIVAAKKGKSTPAYVGTSVLRGPIEDTSQTNSSGG